MPPARWIDDIGATAVDKLADFSVLSDAAAGVADDDEYARLSVRATYIGQGDANAIVGTNDQPLIYFDCGGGCGKAAATYPWHDDNVAPEDRATAADAFDLINEPLIFLSHWDHDHFYSAENVPALTDRTFIAPRQKVSGRYVKFVEENLTMQFWPSDAGPTEFRINDRFSLIVEKCTGAATGNRNYSGLALTLVMHAPRPVDDDSDDDDSYSEVGDDDSDGPIDAADGEAADDSSSSEGDGDDSDGEDSDGDDGDGDGDDEIGDWDVDFDGHLQYILMPGDAPYQYIPTLSDDEMRDSGLYVGLFAYHHGSKTKWNADTTNSLPNPFDPGDVDEGAEEEAEMEIEGAIVEEVDEEEGEEEEGDVSDNDEHEVGDDEEDDEDEEGDGEEAEEEDSAEDGNPTIRRCLYTYGLKPNNMSPFHVPAAAAVDTLREAGWDQRGNTSGNTEPDAVLDDHYRMPVNPFASRGDRVITFYYPDAEEEDEEDDEDSDDDDDGAGGKPKRHREEIHDAYSAPSSVTDPNPRERKRARTAPEEEA